MRFTGKVLSGNWQCEPRQTKNERCKSCKKCGHSFSEDAPRRAAGEGSAAVCTLCAKAQRKLNRRHEMDFVFPDGSCRQGRVDKACLRIGLGAICFFSFGFIRGRRSIEIVPGEAMSNANFDCQ